MGLPGGNLTDGVVSPAGFLLFCSAVCHGAGGRRRHGLGEADERGIRGQASRQETEALIEEGIAVVPLPIPKALKGPIQ